MSRIDDQARREAPLSAYRGPGDYAFMCYSHQDEGEVRAQLQWLHTRGLNVWFDDNIKPGHMWRAEIAERVDGASRVIFFVSASSIASEHCIREINLALDCQREILPIFLEEVELSPFLKISLTGIQAIYKFRLTSGEYADKLENALHLDTAVGEGAPLLPLKTGAVSHVVALADGCSASASGRQWPWCSVSLTSF